jgi:rsbT co-antagonist protein RsbR
MIAKIDRAQGAGDTTPDATEQSLLNWRTQVLNTMLLSISLVGALTLVGSAISAFEEYAQAEALRLVSTYAAGYLLLLILSFVRQLGYTIRVTVLLALLYGFGLLGLVSSGLSGDGRLLLFTFVVLAAILAPRQYALAALALALLTLGIVGWQMSSGQLVIPAAIQANSASGGAWTSGVTTFLLLITLVVLSVSYLLDQLLRSLERAREQAQLAEVAASRADAQVSTSAQQTARLIQVEQDLRELVASLEVSVVPIATGTLLAPLVGPVDQQRAQALQQRLLESVTAQRAHTVILDLSGARATNASIAGGLNQLVAALDLVGSKVVMTGISADLALLLISLEVNLPNVTIASSPQVVLDGMIHQSR